MWPWESIPPKSECSDDWLYQGSHLFTALYRFYKASFWGVGIHIGPITLYTLKDFEAISLNYPFTFKKRFLRKYGIMVRVLMKLLLTTAILG